MVMPHLLQVQNLVPSRLQAEAVEETTTEMVTQADLVAEEELIQALQDLPEDLETKEDILLLKEIMVET
jgi:fructose-1,6-bisphosphatase/inositol monophosphatase family enzyme